MSNLVITNPLAARIRRLTVARVGLARAGAGLTTVDHLCFQRDHARARDAVHLPFDGDALSAALRRLGHRVVRVHSQAADRVQYLKRPDLGRRLDAASVEALNKFDPSTLNQDVVIIVADGLSSTAMHENTEPFLRCFLPLLRTQNRSMAPLIVAEQARVGLSDAIGECLNARAAVMLIGERPGLSAANSMGIYLTFAPQAGRVDAERNCISNVRDGGLSYVEAAHTLNQLLDGAFKLGRSGVTLKVDYVQRRDGALLHND